MAYKLKASDRAKGRACMGRLGRRMRGLGWVACSFWLEATVRDQVRQRAAQLGVPVTAFFRAALEHGIRRVTTSEIIASHKKWTELVGMNATKLMQRGELHVETDPTTGRFTKAYRIKKETAA